jgi:hypothetical protein
MKPRTTPEPHPNHTTLQEGQTLKELPPTQYWLRICINHDDYIQVGPWFKHGGQRPRSAGKQHNERGTPQVGDLILKDLLV